MTTANDLDVGAIVKPRSAILTQCGHVSKRGQDIDLSQRQRGLPNASSLAGNVRTQLGEEPALNLDNFLLRVEDLRFVLLKFRSCEALSVYQCLLAFIVWRNQVKIWLGDFEVVTKN